MEILATSLKKENRNTQIRVLTHLIEVGHSVLPEYYMGKLLSMSVMKKAIFNAGSVRNLFQTEAQNGLMNENRAEAKKYLLAEEMVYAGGFVGERIKRFELEDDGEARYCRFATHQLPEEIVDAYDEKTGIFNVQGLKVWLGYRKGAGETIDLEVDDTIVIAYAGTTFNARQFEANIRQVVESSALYLAAVGLASSILGLYPYHHVAFVGHSLGGGLAQFSLSAVITPFNVLNLTGYCYNSAGLNFVGYESLAKNGSLQFSRNRIFHYSVDGEPVSMYFGLIGKVINLPIDKSASIIERHRLSTVKRLL